MGLITGGMLLRSHLDAAAEKVRGFRVLQKDDTEVELEVKTDEAGDKVGNASWVPREINQELIFLMKQMVVYGIIARMKFSVKEVEFATDWFGGWHDKAMLEDGAGTTKQMPPKLKFGCNYFR